jgi:hypothetical protein
MALTITRSKFEELDHAERHQRIAEGAVVVSDDWQERQAKAARVKAEIAEWNAANHPAMRRAEWEKLPPGERDLFIRNGGTIRD